MKKYMNYKQIFISLAGGVFLSLILSMNHILPALEKSDLNNSAFTAILSGMEGGMDRTDIVWTLLAIGLAFIIYITRYNFRETNYKKEIWLILISAVFGVLNVSGQYMFWQDCLPVTLGWSWIVLSLVMVLGWATVFYMAAYWLLQLFDWLSEKPKSVREDSEKEHSHLKGIPKYIDDHLLLSSFVCILLLWLPWMIIFYPASMDWDVYRQLSSYLGIWAHSNHDPWFSSCVLGVCYQIGVKLGSENLGIFIFVIVRDVLMALIYAKCVAMLKKAGFGKIVYYMVLCFYAVTPVWGAYSKHAFKDTFCAALFVWYIMNLIVLLRHVQMGTLNKKCSILYGLSALILSLFRNNCIYVVAPVTLLVLLFMMVKREKWRYIFSIMVLVAVYFAFNSFIFNFCGVERGSSKEALAIPFQQTARTVRDHEDEITDEEREAIDRFLDYDSMAENYDPLLSDPIKDNSKPGASREDIIDYFVTWFKMFFKYPITYVEAAIGQSFGYYAFVPRFPFGAGNYNSGMTIFNWIYVEAFSEYYSFHYIEAWETGREILASWAEIWDKIPVLNLTNTIALYTWFIFLTGYYLLRKRQISDILPVLALLIMTLTCMASPVNGCFRYFAPVAAATPALLLLLRKSGNEMYRMKESCKN